MLMPCYRKKHRVAFLENIRSISLHCCEFSNCLSLILPSLQFLRLNGLACTVNTVGKTHVHSPTQRAFTKETERINLSAIVDVKSSVIFEESLLGLIQVSLYMF